MRKRVFREKLPVSHRFPLFLIKRFNLAFLVTVLLLTGVCLYATILSNFETTGCVGTLALSAGFAFALFKYLRPPITLKNDDFIDYSHSSKGAGFVPWGKVKDISFTGGRSITAHIYNPLRLWPAFLPKHRRHCGIASLCLICPLF